MGAAPVAGTETSPCNYRQNNRGHRQDSRDHRSEARSADTMKNDRDVQADLAGWLCCRAAVLSVGLLPARAAHIRIV